MPGSDEFSPIIPHLDKIGHFILYGFQAVSLSMYFRKYFFENPNTIVFTICLIVGVIIEFSQPVLTNNRVFDFLDIIANLSGVLTNPNFLEIEDIFLKSIIVLITNVKVFTNNGILDIFRI